ncbi:23S rRNA (adenine(2503)-C(2))-methyltransferase RlmN [Pelagicoccus sp. NFK12]|uniref:Probable dual-specificity RNA methyltransferase RlmN n=1 Tax=Pelagicoccus enzymogenes TaxID=2773457 RepID=A0A927FB62_9BACT|nr:23S rRNA (adenine(2503)-C(2))-methyltransferase RlmN [Pelagicoccus enzymogenes]MBD5780500.1 23S rRNA (adenine(2503)-C(2))-methyltransferase RlmN [Pelagicoccus enzymogenes]MDQ8197600.1 23S rRNA (adenine(2503)-C(2))-methyltransferase RlmN [Pelagicoccus enzymogenes]
MKYVPEKPPIYGESLDSLQVRLQELGEPKFRAKQILEWLYKKRAKTWEAMTNLPKPLREKLANTFEIAPSKRVLAKESADETEKLLLQMGDNSMVETVVIRAPQIGVGQENSRKTICISTQVGCAYGCKFCASGLAGWKRDLSVGEIVSQLIHVCHMEDATTERASEEIASFDNIVVMGMGEPMANYKNLLPALRILNAEWGLNFGARRITISTSGVVPRILELADEREQFRLAISLHGATNEVRDQIMPVNRKYPLEQLLPAIQKYAQTKGRMITLEFILIEEINDTLEQADALTKIALDLKAHVNLIPYNTVDGLEWKRPSIARQDVFYNRLRNRGVSVTIRREKGHDIAAACGQLKLKNEQDIAV